MNFSRIFIERPVMTRSDHVRDSAVRHRRLPRAARRRAAQRRLSDDPGDAPFCPGASPETMASSVATPLEREFSTIAGIQSMSSTNSQGVTSISRCSSRSIATSTPPRRTFRPPSRKPAATAATHAAPAVLSEGEPGRAARALSVADTPARCRSTRSTSTPKRCWRSASRWSAASRACRSSARRNMPCACRWIPTRWPRAASASTKCSERDPAEQHQSADRTAVRRQAGVHGSVQRTA